MLIIYEFPWNGYANFTYVIFTRKIKIDTRISFAQKRSNYIRTSVARCGAIKAVFRR